MRFVVFILVMSLNFSCSLNNDSGNELMKNLQKSQGYITIKTIFDDAKPNELKNRYFGIIIYFDVDFLTYKIIKSANFLAKFQYTLDNESILIDYFYFPCNVPWEEKTNNNQSADVSEQFIKFLNEIIENNGFDFNIDNAMQMEIPLPIGLRNDLLLKKMHAYRYQDRTKNGASLITLDGVDLFFWGFKTDKMEIIRSSTNYSEPSFQISREEIFDPIINAILERHTTKEWKEKNEEWIREQQIKWKESMGTGSSNRIERTKKIFSERGIKLDWVDQYER
ncbi:MAG: hypothetical protein FWG12_06610 [Holophagaceae bacterium]|nr:hypothetical protein [Holophagaceae bacterium]